jgi:quercetin dioxygenase-like cupin family protein
MQTKKIIQQGDVLFIPVDKIPKTAKKVKSRKFHILAEGEVTGHSHRVSVKEADFYMMNGRMFLELRGGVARILHEEHKIQFLTDKRYEIKIIRQWNYDKKLAEKIND